MRNLCPSLIPYRPFRLGQFCASTRSSKLLCSTAPCCPPPAGPFFRKLMGRHSHLRGQLVALTQGVLIVEAGILKASPSWNVRGRGLNSNVLSVHIAYVLTESHPKVRSSGRNAARMSGRVTQSRQQVARPWAGPMSFRISVPGGTDSRVSSASA